jgi:hypothetical protein
MVLGRHDHMDKRHNYRYIHSITIMEEILTGLGGGGIGVGAIIWYVKTRIIKYDKKMVEMSASLTQEKLDNQLQKEQIETLKQSIIRIEKDLRDLRNRS